jgi:glycosyltransferase involved in cell wall biosynthesis
MKNILMISQTVFPPDIRLEKEIRSLSAAGYKVLVVCNQYNKGLNPTFKYCEIIRIRALFNSITLNRIINFPIFFNPRFLITIFIGIRKFKPNFIHAHDLPMAPVGLIYGKIFSVPVILDMHENYPAALRAFQKKGFLNFLFKNYRAARILERVCIKIGDKIITVVDENSNRLKKLVCNPEKVFVVSNTVDLDTFAQWTDDKKVEQKYKDRIILVYTGFVSPERGLETIVERIKYLKEKLPKIKLLIIGDGISLDDLKKIVFDNKLEQFVDFIKWPGHENLGPYLKIADICISPQPQNEHWNNSIPHKLFEYMSQLKPVLVADAIPLKCIIKETNAGMFYKSG